MEKTNILMIGAGRMAEAVISGLIAKETSEIGKITVANRSDTGKLTELEKKYGVNTSSDWEGDMAGHNVIVLASPPGTQDEQLRKIGERLSGQLIITVAAGIDTDYMESRLPDGAAVCWIMPNTAAQIGKSMSIYSIGQFVTEDQKKTISLILSAIGYGEELSNEQVHNLTAVTGSAPAFLYSFAEGLEKAAAENGVTKEQARELVIKMLSGSAAMLEAGFDPGDLQRQVASPGGSTAEGLKVLEEAKFHELIGEAVEAVNRHARSQGEN